MDGWWPDEGDALTAASRLTRIRMYWEGPQLDRPDERPYALHRNGYAGMQRYGGVPLVGRRLLHLGDAAAHVPIAINTGLTGIPFWGTDIGRLRADAGADRRAATCAGFSSAPSARSFRSHGRTWKLRLPWGWNTGELGPDEIRTYGDAANPDPAELHNAAVEPICRKYLELRYRLLPYLYSVVREAHDTGLPIMRALWLHYPDDPAAVARGDEYLWGRDILVAPVTEKGATSRQGLPAARAPGTTSGPRSASRAGARSSGRSTWRRCRSTSAPARSCRSARSSNTPGRRPTAR